MNSIQQCLNCNAPLKAEDNFCASCGQENKNLKISFWEFITEYLSSNFNFDTKLGRTLVDLLLKPGEITRQFIAGKRVRYVKPVQLYFFFSFVFFLLLGINPASFVNNTPPSKQQIEQLNQSSVAEINITGTELDAISDIVSNTDPNNEAELDSVLIKLGDTDIKPWKRHVIKQLVRSMNPENEKQLSREVYANLSLSLFLLLPLFAGLVWLFTKSRSPYYMDALVFSIHAHCVAFILFSLDILLGFVTDLSFVTKLFLLLAVVYVVAALRRVFDLTWLSSIGKTMGITALYSLAFGASFLVIILLSFWVY